MSDELLLKNLEHYDRLYQDPYQKYSFEVQSKVLILEKLLNKILKNIESLQVLDISFGEGSISSFLNKRGAVCYGIEISDSAIKIVQREIPSINVCKAQMTYLPFRSNSFDCIVCSHVIEHESNEQKALEEMKVALKNGGFLILGVPAKDLEKNELHSRIYTMSDIEKLASKYGFKIIFIRSYGSKLFQILLSILYLLMKKDSKPDLNRKVAKYPFKRKFYHRIVVPAFLFFYRIDDLIPFKKNHLEMWCYLRKMINHVYMQ